jgi:acetylornithine deacetylase
VRFPNETGDKAALFATVGPQDRGGIVLSGHADVVPVAGQAWSRDPFTLHVEDGKAYGRGAVDMKAFLALGLALVPDFLAANLKTPIHLFLSYDEEVTCLGVVDGINAMGKTLPRPRAVIVGEPTMLDICDAHKGVRTFQTMVKGFAAHSPSRSSAPARPCRRAARRRARPDGGRRQAAAGHKRPLRPAL